MEEHLLDLKVADLPGVGWSKVAQLEACDIKTVRDVRARSQAFLQQELGSKVGAFHSIELIQEKSRYYF